tara:strand:+ start:748 stop:1068 length:321 start_codon:yes stop_codon:yes gene_type:complete
MTYTWNNKTVDTYPSLEGESDVIFNVHWRLTGTDDSENIGSVYGTQSLETSDLSDFTAFADITEEQVNGWVEAALGEEKVAELKANIDAKIEEKVNPTVVTKTIGE